MHGQMGYTRVHILFLSWWFEILEYRDFFTVLITRADSKYKLQKIEKSYDQSLNLAEKLL